MRTKLTTKRLLHEFSKMSGDQKIRIAMQLSDSVRKVREAGAQATKTKLIPWTLVNKTF